MLNYSLTNFRKEMESGHTGMNGLWLVHMHNTIDDAYLDVNLAIMEKVCNKN